MQNIASREFELAKLQPAKHTIAGPPTPPLSISLTLPAATNAPPPPAVHPRPCISPGSSEIFYSNRSAALAALERFQAALDDAAQAVRLKPRWVKGHTRKAAALMGLKRYSEAKEAYEAALKLEPDDQALQKGRDKVPRRGVGLRHVWRVFGIA